MRPLSPRFLLFVRAFAAFLLLSPTANAHDVWLEAGAFYAKAGEPVDVGIFVGVDLVGEELPNLANWYTDFSYFGENGRQDVDGELGRIPAGYFKPLQAGTYAIGYRTSPTGVELKPKKFNKYLKEEGLDHIIRQRKANGTSNQPGREQFSRAVKTLINVPGNSDFDYASQEFNYTVELTPMQNPYLLRVGERLDVQLKYQGKALANTRITAFTKLEPEQKEMVQSNAEGMARITLNRPGIWLIKAVHMIENPHDDYEWESLWASLTFEIKPGARGE